MVTQTEFDEMQDAAVTAHYEALALRQQVARLEQELKALRAFRDAVAMASFVAGLEAVQPDMLEHQP
jgi:predicted  nucleic acid-binding Zn-ribbon protein